MILVILLQEILMLCHCSELCAFTLLLPLLGQRLGQEPEWDTGQQDHSASHYEAQPPSSHPTRVLVVDGDAVWEREDEQSQHIMKEVLFIGLSLLTPYSFRHNILDTA